MPAGTDFSFETTLSAEKMDQLLSNACLRRYSVVYKHLGVSENGAHKLVTVSFSDPKDAERFRAAVQGGRPAKPQPKKRGLLATLGLG
jgi:prophage antirepressor-like protein